MSVSSPALNMSRITPISAMPARKSFSETRLNKEGPISNPAMISPATCGAFRSRASRPKSFELISMIAKVLKISNVSICVLSPML